ncbi:hypothetical protein [Reinekea sp. G2M2-21]|uniref:hypothetical protein n=1 Tax=Reinekea sp. G2M2-21 TaxID=2788942 RepID=UPI0018A9E5F0|nr:hypothetical protein [Reinekea sp. G2M2-21]
MRRNESAEVTVASARVAGEVYQVGIIARKLSLAAKNAMAMVMRAGSTASGLRVVSDFFSELANTSITSAHQIHHSAVLISHNSVAQWRMNSFDDAMDAACRLNHQSKGLSTLRETMLARGEKRRNELQTSFRKEWTQLINFLEEIDQQIKASSVIAVNFRLEALETGQQTQLLNHMAKDIDLLSGQIKAHVQRSLKLLRDLRIV